MTLYILRHGIAEDPAPGQSDESRQLTPEGRKKTKRVLARAAQAGIEPGLILSSPYPRAKQTAEIAQHELGGEIPTAYTEALVPYANVFELWEEIRVHAAAEQLMVVGHNPLLSDLACWLMAARAGGIEMKKAALAAVEIPNPSPQPRGSLLWMLTPKSSG